MTRTPDRPRYHPLAVVSLAAGLLTYLGCDTAPESGTPATPPASATVSSSPVRRSRRRRRRPPGPRKPRPRVPSPLAGALRRLAEPGGALLISGEQLGYLEPCGCTSGQLGGLLRRYELATQVRDQKKWPLACLDLGSLIKDPVAARGGPEQSKLKFNMALRALALLKYDALAHSRRGSGTGRGRGGRPVSQSAGQPAEGRRGQRRRAGAGGEGRAEREDHRRSGQDRHHGRHRSRVAPALWDPVARLAPGQADRPGSASGARRPGEDDRRAGRPGPGLRPTRRRPSRRSTRVSTSWSAPRSMPTRRRSERLNDGKTLLVTVGHKGKYVGVVGLFPVRRRSAYRTSGSRLDQRYDGPAKPMKDIIEGEFRETLKQQKSVENTPSTGTSPGRAMPRGPRSWASSRARSARPGHRRGVAGVEARACLRLAREGPKPNTVFDVECISCHTVGFEYTSGYASAAQTLALENVQCESAAKHQLDLDHPVGYGRIDARKDGHIAGVEERYLFFRGDNPQETPMLFQGLDMRT